MPKHKTGADTMAWFIRAIGERPLLPEDETRRLIALAQAGDVDARNRVVEANLRLAVAVAKKLNKSAPMDDLVQAGGIGLAHAVRCFRLDAVVEKTGRPPRFATCAVEHIKCEMYKLIREERIVHVPSYLWHKIRSEEAGTHNSIPAQPECMEAARRTFEAEKVSLSCPAPNSDEPLVNTIEDSQQRDLPQYDELDNLYRALDRLQPRYRLVMALRFGLGTSRKLTLLEAGEAIGVTRERARQIEVLCLKQLRSILHADQTA